MRKNILMLFGILLRLAFVLADTNNASPRERGLLSGNQNETQSIKSVKVMRIFVLEVLARNEPKGSSRPLMKGTLSLPRRLENGCSESA